LPIKSTKKKKRKKKKEVKSKNSPLKNLGSYFTSFEYLLEYFTYFWCDDHSTSISASSRRGEGLRFKYLRRSFTHIYT